MKKIMSSDKIKTKLSKISLKPKDKLRYHQKLPTNSLPVPLRPLKKLKS